MDRKEAMGWCVPTVLHCSCLHLCPCGQGSACLSQAPVLDSVSAKEEAPNHADDLRPSPHHSPPGRNN